MDYKRKVTEILEENMTERGYKLWKGINNILPDIWDRPTSSTGKHHKKHDGRVPTQAEHAYEMLYAAVRVFALFGFEKKTNDADMLLMAIALHDSLKYGKFGDRPHTDYEHDKIAADVIKSNEITFKKLFTDEQFITMEESVRFHMGRWSTNGPGLENFDWFDFQPYTLFIHILDMMSTKDLIQTDVRG
ncbi:MAG: hypothetical protein PVG65_04455 [Candidatus Thorarchaeota archaeon]|jgi:hypothetical protein